MCISIDWRIKKKVIDFSSISSKTMIGQVLRFLLKLIPKDMVLPVLQGKLRGKKWIVGSGNYGCWLGSYEYKKRILFETIVTKGSTVFDIGANVGFYTLLASILVGDNGKVYAFEPVPKNISYLRKHIKLNNISNVTVIEAAVSDKNNTLNFEETTSSSTGHISPKGNLKVKAVILDELFEQKIIPTHTFIKIDVEGSEMLVLKGTKNILANFHPAIFLATHGNDIHKECLNFLQLLGYKIEDIGEQDINETDEIIAYAV